MIIKSVFRNILILVLDTLIGKKRKPDFISLQEQSWLIFKAELQMALRCIICCTNLIRFLKTHMQAREQSLSVKCTKSASSPPEANQCPTFLALAKQQVNRLEITAGTGNQWCREGWWGTGRPNFPPKLQCTSTQERDSALFTHTPYRIIENHSSTTI